jgi:hypothetical protein
LRQDLPAAARNLAESLGRAPDDADAFRLRYLLRARRGDAAGSAADAAAPPRAARASRTSSSNPSARPSRSEDSPPAATVPRAHPAPDAISPGLR